MKLYGVYSEDENRNKEIWQTENAKAISGIINTGPSFTTTTFYLIPRKLTLTLRLKGQLSSWDPFQNVNVLFERHYFYNFLKKN